MVAGGLWVPRRLRAPKIQQPRSRRACLGELVQIDGCDHRWFEDRAPACTALVYVDDATSRLMVVLFVGAESTFAYFEATHQYLKHYRKPLAFYSDKASVFRVNKQSAAAGKGHTQFGRALYELNIDGMCANTPAAKRRVERAHQTLQDLATAPQRSRPQGGPEGEAAGRAISFGRANPQTQLLTSYPTPTAWISRALLPVTVATSPWTTIRSATARR
jgi:hypothetical protein